MDSRLWENIKYFSPAEKWGDLDLVKFELIQKLDWLRDAAGVPIHIHCAGDHTGHSPNSYHYRGMAADIHADNIEVGDLFILATRWFKGIGVYPRWNNPGLHLDIRRLEPDEAGKYWISWRKNSYIKLDIRELSICHCKALRNQCLLLRDEDTDPNIDLT
jgi:hypothetical protein